MSDGSGRTVPTPAAILHRLSPNLLLGNELAQNVVRFPAPTSFAPCIGDLRRHQRPGPEQPKDELFCGLLVAPTFSPTSYFVGAVCCHGLGWLTLSGLFCPVEIEAQSGKDLLNLGSGVEMLLSFGHESVHEFGETTGDRCAWHELPSLLETFAK